MEDFPIADNSTSTLGEYLRQERERRGITVDQVASATKVGVRTLHALEADHYVDLPAKPFIRGFVTSYCRFVGLDPKDTVKRFEDYITLKATERPNREAGHSGYAFEKKDGEHESRTFLMMAIIGFVVLGVIAVLLLKPTLQRHRSSHLDRLRQARTLPTETAPAPTPSPVITALATNEPTPTELGKNAADPLDSGKDYAPDEVREKIVLKLLDDSWVRYQVDQKPVRKFIVRKDKLLVLRAKERLVFQAGDPMRLEIRKTGYLTRKLAQMKERVMRQGNVTLIYPLALAAQTPNPFGMSPPLASLEPIAEASTNDDDEEHPPSEAPGADPEGPPGT